MKNVINTVSYRWRSAALPTSKMSVFEASTHGMKRTAPAQATRFALRAWNGPIT